MIRVARQRWPDQDQDQRVSALAEQHPQEARAHLVAPPPVPGTAAQEVPCPQLCCLAATDPTVCVWDHDVALPTRWTPFLAQTGQSQEPTCPSSLGRGGGGQGPQAGWRVGSVPFLGPLLQCVAGPPACEDRQPQGRRSPISLKA